MDYERLRRDLINYFEGAYFVGKIPYAILDADRARYASEDELLSLANYVGIDLENYENLGRSR